MIGKYGGSDHITGAQKQREKVSMQRRALSIFLFILPGHHSTGKCHPNPELLKGPHRYTEDLLNNLLDTQSSQTNNQNKPLYFYFLTLWGFLVLVQFLLYLLFFVLFLPYLAPDSYSLGFKVVNTITLISYLKCCIRTKAMLLFLKIIFFLVPQLLSPTHPTSFTLKERQIE